MREISLSIEPLEERIAPSFILTPGTTPANHASPDGSRGDGTIGPSIFSSPNINPWNAHFNSPVLSNGGT